ncbi:S9 family peptidase [Ferrimonas balearica]|uniref:S9 family peptidase n=1 Tax=Ferrimonas balearica TaxID=44012 RepID=UPI001C99B820|nr:prolyl oligopeptidase family serine peptidase [Ferrimonas balearica]MBY5992756.1 prolyl oligopeptidase family serine peptidase [Ferrimonas balearica]
MRRRIRNLLPLLGILATPLLAAPVTPEAVMGFKSLKDPVLAGNGAVVAFTAAPDRGDPQGRVRRSDGQLFTLERAQKPIVNANGRFVLFEQPVPLLEQENAGAKERKGLKAGRVLIQTQTGKQERFERVKAAAFSHDGRLLVIHFEPEQSEAAEPADEAKSEEDAAPSIDEADLGSALLVRDLTDGSEQRFADVRHFALPKKGSALAFSTSAKEGKGNALYRLDPALKPVLVHQQDGYGTGALVWDRSGAVLGFSWGSLQAKARQREHLVGLFARDALRWQELNHADFMVSAYSDLAFSRDGQRLFIGRQARLPAVPEKPQFGQAEDLTNRDLLLARADLVLWHGDDEQIKTREMHQYDKERKRTYPGVWHLGDDTYVQLTDSEVPTLVMGDNPNHLLASSDKPYRKMISWAGFYKDWYLVDLKTGQRRALAVQLGSADTPTLAPGGSQVLWHVRDGLYHHDVQRNRTRKLADGFSNEDHDYPSPAPGYGFGPWLSGDAGALVYDKYDIWRFDSASGKLNRLTEGREADTLYRVQTTDPDALSVAASAELLVHGVNEQSKAEGLYRLALADGSLSPWQQGDYRVKFLAKAAEADTLMLSFERYDRFPDLYLSANASSEPEQLSRLGDQLDRLDWGQAQLVRWETEDGQPLKGVLITPPGYDGQRPLPTMIYFYRFMSDRLHAFPQMAINHRPNFPWYASEGYAIFLPDVVFEVGRPGPASLKALLSGADKIVEMGVADPKAIGLQGHSWAGYQSAYIVTQTDRFASVVTGAPVSNMTSAYTGIRLGSGLGRQFQYESGQSRIGPSLYEAPDLYIENSPVFYADKVKTPMVIMFGDVDDAVPWQQGIELYLAMRRLAKPVVMLQYQNEPHHPKQYPNKLDYTLKMKAFFDFTLKGAPAPDWWVNGLPYRKPDQ